MERSFKTRSLMKFLLNWLADCKGDPITMPGENSTFLHYKAYSALRFHFPSARILKNGEREPSE